MLQTPSKELCACHLKQLSQLRPWNYWTSDIGELFFYSYLYYIHLNVVSFIDLVRFSLGVEVEGAEV